MIPLALIMLILSLMTKRRKEVNKVMAGKKDGIRAQPKKNKAERDKTPYDAIS